MTGHFDGQGVLVTGGAGFLGSHIVDRLDSDGANWPVVPRSDTFDLRRRDDVDRLFADTRPDVVIHCAATVGGIGYNQRHPGRLWYDNIAMGQQVLDACRRYDVGALTIVGTTCSYPEATPVPFDEGDLWGGYPEPTNAPYGIAKRALVAGAQAYHDEYGLDTTYLLPANLYGPRDDFDPADSHVIPALIQKCVAARELGEGAVTAWGTGEPTREFLYVDDAARGVLAATAEDVELGPFNLGTEREVSIRELAETIADVTGFDGGIEWDESKPDGQPRRKLDTSRARDALDWRPATELREGLAATVDWYERQRTEVIV